MMRIIQGTLSSIVSFVFTFPWLCGVWGIARLRADISQKLMSGLMLGDVLSHVETIKESHL